MLIDLSENLVREDGGEASDALPVSFIGTIWESRKVDLAKELADVLYVAFCAAEALGIPLEKCSRQVHGSNISKLGPDGSRASLTGTRTPAWTASRARATPAQRDSAWT
jgi:predicted HAD superfamily Cof-like phosphohydrolase